MFPVLRHIDDVLPHVEGRSDFIIAKKDGYTVIDYLYTDKDTFDHPVRRECRGLKFGPDGRLIARPFHKFFNYGEKPETTEVDWSQHHAIYSKLDGSMIHPALVNGSLVFMTRMGVTGVAYDAWVFAMHDNPMDYRGFCTLYLSHGLTPIFEWTSPSNRIVVPYQTDALTLLAVRCNTTGNYLPLDHSDIRQFNIPVVDTIIYDDDLNDTFIPWVRSLKDEEGVVVQFESGLFIKIKADEYVKFHRAKDSLSTERRVLPLVLEKKTDDLMPLLAPADKAELEHYADRVNRGIYQAAVELDQFLTDARLDCRGDRKRFATEWVAKIKEPALRSTAFNLFDKPGALIRPTLVRVLMDYTTSNSKIDAIRSIIGNATWRARRSETQE